MLTLVINPGGTARVVTIAEALHYLGHDVGGAGAWPERTPEERLRRREAARRVNQRRQLEQERGRER